MIKRITGLTIGFSLILGGQAFAEESLKVVDPQSDLYDTTRYLEEATYDITTDFSDKVLLQEQYAEKRLREAELAIEQGDPAAAKKLIQEADIHGELMEENLAEVNKTDDIEEIDALEKEVLSYIAKRTEILKSLLVRDDIPEDAKKGIQRAINNQEKVVEKIHKAFAEKRLHLDDREDLDEDAEDEAEEKADKAEDKAEKEREKAEEAAEKAEDKAEKERERAEEKTEKDREKAEEAAERAEEKAEKDRERAEEKAERDREKAEEAAERAEDKAEKERERAEEKAEKERERAEEKAEREREKAEEAAERAEEKAEREHDEEDEDDD
ncbi:DUF5667 domain-containing protein [Virgibacillus halodenitrificans]|uniref:DUF5667 domain-containing protein n=1 Tax=Virgibacillus halodenitrificans TaxID=1482 RepID=UPI000EF52878|nr:DUF5667 domain-containing protein [Virgibacillus halodenitrificans]